MSDGDDEGRGGRRVGVGGGWESDDSGFVVGADEAGGAQAGNAEVRQSSIAVRMTTKLEPEKANGNCIIKLGFMLF